ncbi:phosphotransferase family protein [Streptomyces sp. NPDC004752]
MSADFVPAILEELRLTPQKPDVPLETRSGAWVLAVLTADGQAAYLKATPAPLDTQAIAQARRELRFYQNLASIMPVRTPGLLACRDTEDGVAVLLEAVGETNPAAVWTAPMWAELGRALARLHTMAPPKGAEWNRPDVLKEALAEPDLDRINDFWGGMLPQLTELLARRNELSDEISALQPVFTHGDCHVGNLLHSAGSLVLCDWQQAGIGRAVSDLSFLSVRATPAGVTIPSALIDAYLENRPSERGILRHALVAEELGTFVFLWPPFAAFNSRLGITRVRHRTLALAEQWLDSKTKVNGA